MTATDNTIPWTLYHGTRGDLKPDDLKPDDLISPGSTFYYGKRKQASWVHLTGTLEAAVWAPSWPPATGPAGSTSSRSLCESLIHACGDRARRGDPT